jgi:heptosyltransferase-1
MKRILIVKTSSMGDVIHALPVVSDIKRVWPDALVDWMVEAPFAGLVGRHSLVHRVVSVNLRAWRKRGLLEVVGQWKRLRADLSQSPYDVILDLQGLIKSAVLAKAAIGSVAGPGFGYAREALAALVYTRRGGWRRNAHAVERLRQLAAVVLGYDVEGPPCFGIKTADTYSLPEKPLVWLLHATARQEKKWPEASWRQLAQRLSRMNYTVCLPWGSDQERKAAEHIAIDVPNAVILPKMELHALVDKMSAAHLVVGVDTGLTHLAAALQLPMVALFFATPQWRFAPSFNARAISLGDVGRVPCVDEVFEAAARLMGGQLREVGL